MTTPNPLAPVSYELRLRIAAHSGFPARTYGPDWHVRAIELVEAIDRPFELRICAVSPEVDLDAVGFAGADATLVLRRGHGERRIHGIVLRAALTSTARGRLHLELDVGPVLATQDDVPHSRIFQDSTVPEIVATLLGPSLAAHGRTLALARLQRQYPQRDYVVQWRESDAAFAARVLADEGIACVFDHAGDHELLTLVDDDSCWPGAEHDPFVDNTGPRPIRFAGDPLSEPTEETISYLAPARAVAAAGCDVAQWNWRATAPLELLGSASTESPAPWQLGTAYHHDEHRHADMQSGTIDDTDAHAARLLTGASSRAATHRGWSDVVALCPGSTFELHGHPVAEVDQDYLVTRVVHRGECPEPDADGSDSMSTYVNEFDCVPRALGYRPQPRPRPSVSGPHTAIVVGPPGEEIHTDEFGRIRVRFPWDRDALPDDTACCWLRTVQCWAGPSYGALVLPRVGMEVVVSFIDGDPDRPLCTGCVYNGTNMPPRPLPDTRSRSVFRTASTPGGDGFNELSIEDAAGHEEIYVHAQRDLVEHVRATHRTSVGGDEVLTVHKDRSKTVDRDERRTIKGSRTTTIDGSDAGVVVGGRVVDVWCTPPAGSATTGVDELKVHGAHKLWAKDRAFTEVGGTAGATATFEITPDEVVFRVPKRFVVHVGNTKLELTPDVLEAFSAACTLRSMASSLELDTRARLRSEFQAEVRQDDQAALVVGDAAATLSAPVTVVRGAGAGLTLHSEAHVMAAAVHLRETALGTSSCSIHPSGILIDGTNITSVAAGAHTICGARVDLNPPKAP